MRLSRGAFAAHALVYLFFFVACSYLFYHEATGEFYSDLHAQLMSALDPEVHTYSLNSAILVWTYNLFGYWGVAVFLALEEVLTIAITEYLLKKLCPCLKASGALVFAVLLNLVISIYVPILHDQLFRGMSTGNKWHNSTYLGMRLFALVAILFYLRISGRIPGRVSALDWLLFTVSVLLATSFKPSFYTIFVPTVFILCLADLMRNGRSSLKRSLLLGLCLLVPLAVIALQADALYGSSAQTGKGNGIAIGFAVVWGKYNDNVPAAMLQSWAFALFVLAGSVSMFKKDSNYRFAWIMFLFGLAEWLFLYETGERKWHGNFGWACSFAVFYLMLSSMVALIKSRPQVFYSLRLIREDASCYAPAAGDRSESIASRLYVYTALGLFALHAFAGIVLFLFMLGGVPYDKISF